MSQNRLAILKDRALMMQSARSFFSAKNVLEVDVPILSPAAPIDPHIDCIEAHIQGRKCYMHTSPEYGMKRLLAEGIGDIYQLSHVFRDGEIGERHNPEFTMVEWYRVGMNFEEFILETCSFLQLFLRGVPIKETLTYKQAFEKFASKVPTSEAEEDELLGFEVEPNLGRGGITILRDFPLSKAALAVVGENGVERFELFYKGIELANGYHELRDAGEQSRRLEEANRARAALGKATYPIDEPFLKALEMGLPDCCGVAVGFDRLMMLRHESSHIESIMPFVWR